MAAQSFDHRRRSGKCRNEKSYAFATDTGGKTLKGLFAGRSRLLVRHFMFGPDYNAGCPSCSMIADGFNGFCGAIIHNKKA
jgi:predicted dithiol-disulfide oxidoreductase (DUF899 family)